MGRRTSSEITLLGDGTAKVSLSQGYHAIIDVRDIPIIREYRWHVKPSRFTHYAACTLPNERSSTAMHRMLMGLGNWDGRISVDHINGDGLDNRRCNLRLANRTIQKLNQRVGRNNTSGELGVHLRPTGLWQARFGVGKKRYSLGHFKDYNQAVHVQQTVRRIVADLLDCSRLS